MANLESFKKSCLFLMDGTYAYHRKLTGCQAKPLWLK